MQHSVFFSLSGDEQVLLVALTSLLLADALKANQLGILGNFPEVVGQNLLVIQAVVAAQPTPLRKDCSKSNHS